MSVMRRRVLGVVLALLSAISGIALAQDSATALSVAAQKECDLGRAARERAVRLAHFQQSQTLAERAVASDDQLADAHFALFCSIGEQMRIDGMRFSSAFGFRRMMAALDRALELNPEHLDALLKGAVLVRLPAFLGDAYEGRTDAAAGHPAGSEGGERPCHPGQGLRGSGRPRAGDRSCVRSLATRALRASCGPAPRSAGDRRGAAVRGDGDSQSPGEVIVAATGKA